MGMMPCFRFFRVPATGLHRVLPPYSYVSRNAYESAATTTAVDLDLRTASATRYLRVRPRAARSTAVSVPRTLPPTPDKNAHQHVSCVAANPTQAHDNDQGISDVLKPLLEEKSVARKKLVLQLWRDIAMKGGALWHYDVVERKGGV